MEWKNVLHEWARRPENTNTVLTKSTFCPLLKQILEKENLPLTIINGFRKCGLYPLDPNALDYTKCVQDNLKKCGKQGTDKVNSTQKIKKRHLTTAIKIVKQLSGDLGNAGIDAEIVINVIEMAKEIRGTENLLDSTNSTTNEENEILDTDRISVNQLYTNNSSTLISNVIEIPSFTLPVLGDVTLENNLLSSQLDENLNLDTFEINPSHHNQNIIVENEVLVTDNKINKEHVDIIDQILNKSWGMEVFRAKSIEEKTADDKGNGIIIKHNDYCDTQNIENETYIFNNNNEELGVDDNKPKQNIKILSNLILKTENISPNLNKHLVLPNFIKKTKTLTSINRIGAISSEEWRQFERRKEEEKERKKAGILERKLKRIEAKEEKEEKMRKRKAELAIKATNIKKNKRQKKTNLTCTVTKIKCAECDEEMISDTEINDLKNIGCDRCSAWYHLKCTEFSGKNYENVINCNFKCPKCKTISTIHISMNIKTADYRITKD
ncbi:hypothetical protein ABEB36_015493 [Hypothenemus hampei]|uniref:PHD-type domain-containing protein n=1 Tax=Hypothenemus hampei TaxID=57062 RepID=A0ABD1DZW5_HYPHA